MDYDELLQDMNQWCKLMETGSTGNHGAALSPVDAHNLLCLLDEARQAIEELRRNKV